MTKKKGVWICYVCRHGYKGSDRNRYAICAGCPHKVFEDCKARNKDTAAEMKAEDAENAESGDYQEEHDENDDEEEVEYKESDVSDDD